MAGPQLRRPFSSGSAGPLPIQKAAAGSFGTARYLVGLDQPVSRRDLTDLIPIDLCNDGVSIWNARQDRIRL